LLPWLATALRRQLESIPDRTPRRRRLLMRHLRAAVRRALRVARSFRAEMPHALREAALLAALEGRTARARPLFDASLAEADRQGARYEHAQTLLARGQVGLEARWAGAAGDVTAAEQALAALEVPPEAQGPGGGVRDPRPVTLALADRFETLLDVGRRLASSLTRDDVTGAVRDAGLRLLRGERCAVLDLVPGPDGRPVAPGAAEAGYSRAMIAQALQTRRAVAFVEGLPDTASESLLLSGARSSLCAPVLVRGRPAACLYVTHRQVARLFGPEEERLADFVAALAGAALENAENFAELRRLNATLELRIRDRREAEKRIQEQAALLDKSQDAIGVLDLEDRVLYWNRSAERLYGWTAAEALGRDITQLVPSGPPAVREEALRTVLEKGEWTGELQHLTRAGEKITVESRWTLVRDDAGRPKARLIVNTNVTERKKVEAQFLRAQRMESIGTLAGGIAHDLNNVLTPVLMAVDLLRARVGEPGLRELLNSVEASAERGAEMVRQILSFARGVEGQRVVVQLKHLVRDLEKVLGSTLPKSITVEAHVPRDLWVLSGDATQLYQVLMNLCVNARDAMPQGGRLRLAAENRVLDEAAARVHPDARPGRYVVARVADTGTGIPPEILDRIFDPFFTTKEIGKGTGLGLSTVLGIVRGHGGFVTVSSEVGRGTEFGVYLPAAEQAAAGPEGRGPRASDRGRGELILVVDDEAPVRTLMAAALEGHGYRVRTAREGNEALTLFARHRAEVRLVITDVMMPGMDGPATIRALRKLDPALPVVAASGLAETPGPAGPRLGEVQGFLPKPFTTDELLAAVREALAAK
jgi:PAS domain S-box-containing protein